ncbi:LysR family transcriptional regulator [Pseudoclavibacter sp. RFBA6]|uniref:LysR family transcriptional regulator n=1 Tax=Pseudoclavibacter sp. RFBA6 TaxID=2080573 RepID=UPI000CE7F12A|nr:LysR family transcriptional regulator [Pseudoclavibacter sp. RFBA6]PPG40084.1 LysR family transcriptional regulator [Pseudoclavibacter sp. RFBA6]
MEFRHLELLRELSMRRTLAAVAEATHRTPSALSQQLKTAEREFGARLVEPFSRGLRLTTAGQILADGADEVGRALAEVQARLEASLGEPSGTVSIGALPSASEALFPGLLRRTAGSAIDLELDDFDLAESEYAARTLDADIVIGHSLTGDVPRGAEHLHTRVLAREPIDVALPSTHPLASQQRLAPHDLVGTTWVGVPVGYPFDSILIAVENATSTNLERVQRLRDNRLVEALVAAGSGLALLPRFTTRPRPGVVLRPLDGVRSVRSIVALARPDRHARFAVRTVLDHLTSAGEDLEATFAEAESPRS